MKIAIAGCAGRMGRALIECVLQHATCELVGGSVRPGSDQVAQDLALMIGKQPIGVEASADAEHAFQAATVIIDFTLPDVAMSNLDYYQAHQKKVVLGGTNFSADQLKAIQSASKDLAIVHAPNMSLGVNLCLKLSEIAASLLRNYDIDILEAHHRYKVDAPSGTALALGKAVANARDANLEDLAVYDRRQHNQARKPEEIGFAVMRGGHIFGEHTVMFAGDHERVELTHKATSRHAFAQGAIMAALWLKDKKPGLFNMMDVLELSKI